MKLEHLQAFESVARLGNFTRAADEQFMTQPSLSRQIAALESDLGVGLFQRGRNGAEMTPAGQLLLPRARRMLADAQTARLEMAEIAGLARGRVQLGAPPTLCASLVGDVLAGFRAAHPGVELEVTEAGSVALLEALDEGALDLALVVTRDAPLAARSVAVRPLLREELVVVAAAGAKPQPGPPADAASPAQRQASDTAGEAAAGLASSVTLAQVAAMELVAFNRSYDLRMATDAAFEAAGLTPRIAVEGAEMDAVLSFVERGIGVAVVPAMVVIDRPGLVSARVVEPALERTVNVATRRGVRPTAAASAMEEFVLSAVARLGDGDSDVSRHVTVLP